jgi:hypothetical protein
MGVASIKLFGLRALDDIPSAYVPRTFYEGWGHRGQSRWRLFASICMYEIIDPVTDAPLKPPLVS